MLKWAIIFTTITGLSSIQDRSCATDAVPHFTIAANCRAESPDAAGTDEALSKCVHDEEQAKQNVAQAWSQFASQDKETCIKETNIESIPSYVELQVCLEIARDVQTSHRDTELDRNLH
jgi:hypothetical protein